MKAFYLKFLLIFNISFFAGFCVIHSASATIYYVDNTVTDVNIASSTPDCTNYNPESFTCSGGAANAFANVADINVGSFSPGDQILFRRGKVFREKLTIPSSGTVNNLITFGAFGTGDNPKFNGSSVMNNATFTPYSVANSIYTGNVFSNQADGATRNYRQTVTFSSASTHVKIKLTAASTANWVIVGVAIGQQISTKNVSSMTRITFGGNDGVTINAATSATSDNIAFSVEPNVTYLVHIYMTARNMKVGSGQTIYYDSNVSDETMVISPSGSQLASSTTGTVIDTVYGDDSTIWSATSLPSYSVSSLTASGTTATVTTITPHHLSNNQYISISGASPEGYNVSDVLIFGVDETHFRYTVPAGLSSPATGTITYSINHPIAVWENNIFLAKQSSISNVAAGAGRWYYDTATDTIYINGLSQDDPVTNGKVYETARLSYCIWDNQKDYIEIESIDCLETVGLPGSDGAIGGNGMSGIYLQGSYNIIHDLETYNTGRHGFSFYTGSTDNLGYNLSVHDDINTTAVTIYGVGTANNILRNSSIYHSQAATSANAALVLHGTSNYNIVEKNDFYGNGSVGLIVSYDTSTNNNIIRFNNFRGVYERAIYISNSGTGAPSGFTIYGNIFNGSNATSDLIIFSNSGGHSVYNNTFISPISASTGAALKSVSSQNNTVKNNIFYGPWNIRVSDVNSEAGFISDYNEFYGTSGTKWTWGGTDYTSFSDWKINSLQDANSLNSDPKFIDISSDLSLQPTSPCINAGTDLSLTSDYNGRSVPQGSAPDMGAYEYPYYTIAYSASSHGSISGSSSQSIPSGGTSSSVTAIPDTGYKFVNWSDGSTDTIRNEANVTANHSYAANFGLIGSSGNGVLLLQLMQAQQQSQNNNQSQSNQADTQSQIQSLLNQIENLKQQIANLQKNQSQNYSHLTQTLKYGSSGQEVKILQDKLKQLGFFSNNVESNGNFGPTTLKAVQRFQLENNIVSPDIYGYGIVGPKTRQKLNAQ
ncbi:MAG: peptidoglycan-binding protein [Paludibacter sp.]|nr:peptidoglycan-binding protein [Paludibacter sp.]